MKTLTKQQLAGITLVATSLGFIAVFGYLAANFGYPGVLQGSAAHVLPALIAGGAPLRCVWVIYAALPAGVAIAAWLAAPAFAAGGERLSRVGLVAALLAAAAMTAGLARWPTLQWTLGERFLHATPAEQAGIAASFDAANLYLGNVTGEFIGELALSAWFLTIGLAALRGANLPRWVGYLGLFTACSMTIGAFRNLTAVVSPVAALNNNLLPLWLIIVGVTLVVRPAPHHTPDTGTLLRSEDSSRSPS